MRILVFGAGVLGSVYAGRLAAAGLDVALLARGGRLETLCRSGLVLFDEVSHEEIRPQVRVVAELRAEDDYDLVLVLVRADQALEALPLLATNRNVSSFLLLNNQASGPARAAAELGQKRVLLGFPGA